MRLVSWVVGCVCLYVGSAAAAGVAVRFCWCYSQSEHKISLIFRASTKINTSFAHICWCFLIHLFKLGQFIFSDSHFISPISLQFNRMPILTYTLTTSSSSLSSSSLLSLFMNWMLGFYSPIVFFFAPIESLIFCHVVDARNKKRSHQTFDGQCSKTKPL